MQCVPCKSLHCYWDYSSRHSSQANVQCWKCIQVCFNYHFRVEDSWFFRFNRHWIFEFILQGGSLQTQLVAMVIFLTMYMLPHHYIERLTRQLWRSLPYLKFIKWQSSACLECEISSVLHIGFGYPATSPKSCGPWLRCAILFLLSLPSFWSHFLFSSYPMLGYHLPNILLLACVNCLSMFVLRRV